MLWEMFSLVFTIEFKLVRVNIPLRAILFGWNMLTAQLSDQFALLSFFSIIAPAIWRSNERGAWEKMLTRKICFFFRQKKSSFCFVRKSMAKCYLKCWKMQLERRSKHFTKENSFMLGKGGKRERMKNRLKFYFSKLSAPRLVRHFIIEIRLVDFHSDRSY